MTKGTSSKISAGLIPGPLLAVASEPHLAYAIALATFAELKDGPVHEIFGIPRHPDAGDGALASIDE